MSLDQKIYTSICCLFSVLIVVGNMTYQKFVVLSFGGGYSIELSVGAITYPLTFLLTDIIAELYGKPRANFCVKLGVAMNITVASIIALMTDLEATNWSKIDDEIFERVFGFYSLSFISSIIACYIAQLVDINLFMLIKKMTNGKFLWLRSALSSTMSLFIDTSIVVSILAAFSIIPTDKAFLIISNSYVFKIFFIFGIALFLQRR